jgi:hypothetical protein
MHNYAKRATHEPPILRAAGGYHSLLTRYLKTTTVGSPSPSRGDYLLIEREWEYMGDADVGLYHLDSLLTSEEDRGYIGGSEEYHAESAEYVTIAD